MKVNGGELTPRRARSAAKSLHCPIEVGEVLLDLSPGHSHKTILCAPRVEQRDALVRGVVTDDRIRMTAHNLA